ncbi:DUF262 domain-containing protein [Acinetobacter variabilis]|uniref:GmrSD restriction endonuclease domain-containing protein n=1 Tax=Acinetobacter variabilis TaxID=70346 RepID=UPI003A85C111
MSNRDPSPEVLRIEQLVNQVKTGDIRLPKFQRPFVWKKSDVLKLWDSVYKGYPIGSVLLWLTKEKLASERNIAGLIINEREEEYPTNYLLDGQQRLSTLCGGLYWDGNEKNSIWDIWFDCDKEEFLYPDEEDKKKVNLFPLSQLLDTRDFLKQSMKLQSAGEEGQRYQNNAVKLLNQVKDYKIAAVKIGDMSLSEVAPIFERINSSGRQLTMVDLMRAATWKDGFDLNDAIEEIKNTCEKKNFADIKDTHILRSISACTGRGIHKEDIEKLRDRSSDELKTATTNAVNAYKLAVDFLSTEIPLPSISYLPYALQLTYVVEFFNICPKPDIFKRKKLTQWFWETSLSLHYGKSNTGLITSDLAQIRAFAKGDIEKPLVSSKISLDKLLEDNFILNKASSLTLALLLASGKPRSFLDGSLVDITKSLAVINKLEYHHIFPKEMLFSKLGISKRQADYHANISMQNLTSNREISDASPSTYFLKLEKNLGEHLNDVLSSHFITPEAFELGKIDDYSGFIELRKQSLYEQIKNLVSAESEVL